MLESIISFIAHKLSPYFVHGGGLGTARCIISGTDKFLLGEN